VYEVGHIKVKALLSVALTLGGQTGAMENLTTLSDGRKGSKGTGGRPRVPVGFGMYECGRSAYDPHKKERAYAWCRDTLPQGVTPARDFCQISQAGPINVNPQMDPGQYTPYRDFGESDLMRSQSRQRRAFDSTEVRELVTRLFGKDAPPAIYNNVHGQYDYAYYKNFGGGRNAFTSTSLQRPESRSEVPGPDHYAPNLRAVYGQQVTAGGMRSQTDRFGPLRSGMGGQKCQTDEVNGPGTYEQNHGTLQDDCQFEVRRMSKIKAPFGTTTPQRSLPFYNRDASPDVGPGHYEPIMPRTKDRLRMQKLSQKTPTRAPNSARSDAKVRV